MSDEFERIARLKSKLPTPREDVLVGIGDDAAVLRGASDGMVVTVDASVEGTHFKRAFADWSTLARRALVAAASDIAAMGASPRAAVVAMNLPADIDDTAFDQLIDGSGRAVRELSASLIGGNLASSRELSMTTTWIGSVSGPSLLRSGAKAQDGVFVTGVVGAAALGLAALMKENFSSKTEPFVNAWRNPNARVDIGLCIRNFATACIDVSDGLAQDLAHLCQASGVAAQIDATRLPLLSDHHAVAALLKADAWASALAGGEDYELLYTAPLGSAAAQYGTCIGHILEGRGVEVLGVGTSSELSASGYVHFKP